MSEPIVKVLPGNGAVCTRELRLDPVGKPIQCECHAIMQIVIDGRPVPVCKRHAAELTTSVENGKGQKDKGR